MLTSSSYRFVKVSFYTFYCGKIEQSKEEHQKRTHVFMYFTFLFPFSFNSSLNSNFCLFLTTCPRDSLQLLLLFFQNKNQVNFGVVLLGKGKRQSCCRPDWCELKESIVWMFLIWNGNGTRHWPWLAIYPCGYLFIHIPFIIMYHGGCVIL